MEIREFIKNTSPFFVPIEDVYITMNDKGEPPAQWYEVTNSFEVEGVNVDKGDIMLFDTTNGQLKGVFKPIEGTDKQQTDERGTN